jgi:hypothetical protein
MYYILYIIYYILYIIYCILYIIYYILYIIYDRIWVACQFQWITIIFFIQIVICGYPLFSDTWKSLYIHDWHGFRPVLQSWAKKNSLMLGKLEERLRQSNFKDFFHNSHPFFIWRTTIRVFFHVFPTGSSW